MMSLPELYSRYADQINCLLRDKSQMWCVGFKNGVLSNKGLPAMDPFLALHASDYDLGFREGVSYAIYKLAQHVEDEKSPSKFVN